MKRAFIIIIVLVVVILLALPKLGLWGNEKKKMSGPQGPGTVPVSVHVTAPADMEDRVVVGGSVMANEEVELIAEVAGKITGIFFKEGDEVKKGQLLVKINDDELRAALSKLELARKLAKDKEQRQKVLLDKGGISQQEYDVALTELSSIEEDIKRTNAQIAKTDISAPFSGKIGLRSVSEGSYVSPNTKIASLVNSNPVKIDFSVPEKYAFLISKGQKVTFYIQGADTSYTAAVYALEPKIDEVTRTLNVRALSPNDKGKLIPGSFARVELGFKPSSHSVSIPSEAIIPVLKGQKVFVVKDGKAKEQMIETGIRNDRMVEVISGLSPGDSVVTSGILQLRPGSVVKVASNKKQEETKQGK